MTPQFCKRLMREEFLTAWRIYAAAALQGLTATNPKAHAERYLPNLCSQAAFIADLMIGEEMTRLERDKNRPSITATERETEDAELLAAMSVTQDEGE